MTKVSLDELKEKLAAIEHERWADWQKWVHSRLGEGLSITPEDYQRWEFQIRTPYDKLTRPEQESDLREVERYWPLIEAYVEQERQLAREEWSDKFNEAMAKRSDMWWDGGNGFIEVRVVREAFKELRAHSEGK